MVGSVIGVLVLLVRMSGSVPTRDISDRLLEEKKLFLVFPVPLTVLR
jgi:hypothetical protein